MKLPDFLKAASAFIIGAAAVYFLYAKPTIAAKDEAIIEAETARETAEADYERISFISPLILSVDASTANTYHDYYLAWNNGSPQLRINAYNINNELYGAMQKLYGDGISGMEGFRTKFALQTSFTPGDPSALDEMYMIVYPADASGHIITSVTSLYMVRLQEDYSRPCPPHCD